MRKQGTAAVTGFTLLLACVSFSLRAWAAGVVGTGTPLSCTDAALDAALAGGGLATFNCGGPATINVSIGTGTKIISADTTIDGGSLITISGGNSVVVFSVFPGVKFTVQNLTIANGNNTNDTDYDGGGISNHGGMLTITNTVFSRNSADGDGGAIYSNGILSVTNSTFSGNRATNGGGISSHGGTLTIINGTFSSNYSAGFNYSGGAIYINDGTATVSSSTFSGNIGGDGGGISNSYNGTLTVTNSTFSGNSADGHGGGISNVGLLTVTNSTFSGNRATNGGGISNPGGTLTVINTIVANSTSGGNCYFSVTDGGHNLDGGTSCGFSAANGSLRNTDPQLDPAGLHDNGGPTQTIALQAGSPAINTGDEAVCTAPPVNSLDQRGFSRPGAGATTCSIGAYEYSFPGCCQCPASCAAPINGSCGGCTAVVGATCKSGDLCVLNTPAATSTTTPTPSITVTPTITPTPSPTSTNTPGANDCCQCVDFCAPPVGGTCGGCTVVFGAPCTRGLCDAHIPTRTPTAGATSTPKPCVGDCSGNSTVTVDEIIVMVNIALGGANVSGCTAGDADASGDITINEIIAAVNNALTACPDS